MNNLLQNIDIICGLLWGIFSLISDFVLSFLVSDIAVIMYQAVLTKNFSTNLSDSTIVSAILYLILHVLMVFTRIVIFNAYGKRFKFSKLFILICSFIPAIGYAAISIQKNYSLSTKLTYKYLNNFILQVFFYNT